MSSQAFDYLVKNKSVVVQAGAGAGKTTDLTELVYQYLQHFYLTNKFWPQIAVCTFTKKATHELRERIMKKALKEQNFKMLNYIQTSSDLQVTTLHGIFLRYLRNHGGVIGLSSHFKVSEDYELVKENKFVFQNLIKSDIRFKEIFEDLQSTNSISDLLDGFVHHSQLKLYAQLITSLDYEDLMRELVHQLKLIQKDLLSLSLMVSQEATKTWQDWVLVLKQPIDEALKNLSHDDWQNLFKVLQNHSPPRTVKSTSKDCVSLKDLITERVDKVLKYHNYLNFNKTVKSHKTFDYCADKFMDAWISHLIAINKVSMNSIEYLTLLSIQKDIESAKKFSSLWNVWFIDEYQDTSLIQTKILEHLVGSSSCYLVGDPQQSIYLFRGANDTVFKAKQHKTETEQGLLFEKLINYRSDEKILNFINSLSKALGDSFKGMESSKKLSDSTVSECFSFNPVSYFQVVDDDHQDQIVIQEILYLSKFTKNLSEICILARTNKDLQAIASTLKNHNIPVLLNQSDSFLQKQETQDVLCLLKFLVTPEDSLNLLKLCGSPWISIDCKIWYNNKERSLWSTLKQIEANKSIEELKQALNLKEILGELKVWWYLVQKFEILSYYREVDQTGQAVANIWQVYFEVCCRQKSDSSFSYHSFFEKISTQFKINSLVQQAVPIKLTNQFEQKGFVQLMTIHAAKGLQFKHVFIIGVNKPYRFQSAGFWIAEEQKKIWAILSTNEDKTQDQVYFKNYLYHSIEENLKKKELDEYYRLLYVAVTRAISSIRLFSVGKISKNSWSEKVQSVPEEDSFKKYLLEDTANNRSYVEFKEISLQKTLSNEDFSVPDLISKNMKIDQSVSFTKKKNMNKESLNLDIKALLKIQKGIFIHEGLERSSQLADDKLKSHFESFEDGVLLKAHENGFKEWSFSYLLNQNKIRGQIDLWFKADDGHVFVIDYKTGSQAYIEKAFQQLRFYTFALHKLKKINIDSQVSLIVTFPLDCQSEKRQAPRFEELEKEITDFLSSNI